MACCISIYTTKSFKLHTIVIANYRIAGKFGEFNPQKIWRRKVWQMAL